MILDFLCRLRLRQVTQICTEIALQQWYYGFIEIVNKIYQVCPNLKSNVFAGLQVSRMQRIFVAI